MNGQVLAADVTGVVVIAVFVSTAVALVGVAVFGLLVERWRRGADARLDDTASRVLEMAVALSDQTRAEGHEARLRLIRAAHAAMNEAGRGRS